MERGGAPCPRSLFLLLHNGSACSIIQIRSPPKEGGPKKCAVENDGGVGMGDLSSLFFPGANCGWAAEREGKEEVECCCFMSRPLSTHSRGGRGGVVAPGWEEEEGRFFPPPPPFGKHTPTMQVRKWPT